MSLVDYAQRVLMISVGHYPLKSLLKALFVFQVVAQTMAYLRPVIDYVEVFPPTAALLAGNASNVPVMIGTNRGMLRLFQQECSDTVSLVYRMLSPHDMDPKLAQKV